MWIELFWTPDNGRDPDSSLFQRGYSRFRKFKGPWKVTHSLFATTCKLPKSKQVYLTGSYGINLVNTKITRNGYVTKAQGDSRISSKPRSHYREAAMLSRRNEATRVLPEVHLPFRATGCHMSTVRYISMRGRFRAGSSKPVAFSVATQLHNGPPM